MNSVSAVSMPFASDGAREALSNPGVAGIAAMAVEGFGRRQGHTESSRTAGYAVDFFPKTEVEVAIDDTSPGLVTTAQPSCLRWNRSFASAPVNPVRARCKRRDSR